MAKYEDIKKKAKDALETIADVSAEAYRVAEEKAKILAKRARLNSEISREKTVIRRNKIEIGIRYYELHKDDAEDALKENVENITGALAKINIKRKELEDLKKNGLGGCECAEADCCEPAPEEPEAKNETEE